MEILSDRIGVLLKYGKMMNQLTKRYFFIDNKGNLYYTEKEATLLKILKHNSYDEDKFIKLFSNNTGSNIINLKECSISEIKPLLENKFDLHMRSYFELFLKSREYKTILIFAWREDFTKILLDYISSIGLLEDLEKNNNKISQEELIKDDNSVNKSIFSNNNINNNNNIKINELMEENENTFPNNYKFLNSKNIIDYQQDLLNKLGGRFVKQKDWEKDNIIILNPTSELIEYEETWVELENGSNYSGRVKNGMPQGFGKEYRPDGSLYTGYFNKGKWHGPGTLTNETLDSYQGEFIDGCICGI